MPSVRQIKRRIRSVENTAKITKAMSMIAASKMRRAQEAAISGRPYADLMRSLLADLAAQPQDDELLHGLLTQRKVNNVEIVHITPDRGLTGGLNSNVNRAAGQFMLKQEAGTTVVAVGKKGGSFMTRSGANVKAIFTGIGDRPTLADVTPIARIVIDDYMQEKVDAVYVAYADFVSTTVQRPVVQKLLPVGARPIYRPSTRSDTSTSPTASPCSRRCSPGSSRCSSTTSRWRAWPASSRPAWSPCATRPTTPTRWRQTSPCS